MPGGAALPWDSVVLGCRMKLLGHEGEIGDICLLRDVPGYPKKSSSTNH